MTEHALPIWTIYAPGHFHHGAYVIRKHYSWSMCWPNGKRVAVTGEERGGVAYATLEECREHCRSLGLVNINRQPGDHPAIVESWL